MAPPVRGIPTSPKALSLHKLHAWFRGILATGLLCTYPTPSDEEGRLKTPVYLIYSPDPALKSVLGTLLFPYLPTRHPDDHYVPR